MTSRVIMLAAVAGGTLLCASASVPRTPTLLWNTTASAPLGVYTLRSPQPLSAGDLVVVRPPARLAGALDAGGYLPFGVPLLKVIAAVPPSVVCRRGAKVAIDGRDVAVAKPRDRRGRPLPVWSGCGPLAPGSIFLLNAEPNSLDSRYFGPLPATAVMGRADPLWTWEAR